jgi:hypothetical protein
VAALEIHLKRILRLLPAFMDRWSRSSLYACCRLVSTPGAADCVVAVVVVVVVMVVVVVEVVVVV